METQMSGYFWRTRADKSGEKKNNKNELTFKLWLKSPRIHMQTKAFIAEELDQAKEQRWESSSYDIEDGKK